MERQIKKIITNLNNCGTSTDLDDTSKPDSDLSPTCQLLQQLLQRSCLEASYPDAAQTTTQLVWVAKTQYDNNESMNILTDFLRAPPWPFFFFPGVASASSRRVLRLLVLLLLLLLLLLLPPYSNSEVMTSGGRPRNAIASCKYASIARRILKITSEANERNHAVGNLSLAFFFCR